MELDTIMRDAAPPWLRICSRSVVKNPSSLVIVRMVEGDICKGLPVRERRSMHSNRDAQEIALRRGNTVTLVAHEGPRVRSHGSVIEKAIHVRHTPDGSDPNCRRNVLLLEDHYTKHFVWGVWLVRRIPPPPFLTLTKKGTSKDENFPKNIVVKNEHAASP